MNDKDCMFAQNWVEQFRYNVMAQSDRSLTDLYDEYNQAYTCIMAICWSHTREDRLSERSVWCHRYEEDLIGLIR